MTPGDRLDPRVTAGFDLDAVAGLEHVGAERRRLDLAVERLAAVVGVNQIVEAVEIQLRAVALETEEIVHLGGIVGLAAAVIVVPCGIAAGAQGEAEPPLILNRILGLLDAGMLANENHVLSVPVVPGLGGEPQIAGGAERGDI